jgi:hypothetical protein
MGRQGQKKARGDERQKRPPKHRAGRNPWRQLAGPLPSLPYRTPFQVNRRYHYEEDEKEIPDAPEPRLPPERNERLQDEGIAQQRQHATQVARGVEEVGALCLGMSGLGKPHL